MTQGFEGNRKAITSGFDKMDEDKRWDLQQLPGFEATLHVIEEGEDIIEGEEKEDEGEDIIEKIKIINARIKGKIDSINKLTNKAKKAKKEENFELTEYYLDRTKEEYDSIKEMEKERKRLQEILDTELEEESVKKPITTTVTYGKEQMDKYLNNKEAVDLLNFNGLKLPSEYKDKSLKEFQEAFDKGLNEAAYYKISIKDVAK